MFYYIKRLFVFFTLAVLIFPQYVQAVGVGVNPSSLDIEFLDTQTSKKAELVVFNISDEPSYFEIYMDDLEDWVLIEPFQFFLEPHQSQRVSLFITPKESGRIATNISVVARPINKQGFRADSGLKVPLRLNVLQISGALKVSRWMFYVGWGVLLSGLILLVFGFYYWYRQSMSLKKRIFKKLNFLRK